MTKLFISTKIEESSKLLIEKGFTEKPAAIGDDSKQTHLLINKKAKTFFLADDEVLEYTTAVVADITKKPCKKISLKKIKNWN